MPNGGTETGYALPYKDRDIDLLYTGRNQPVLTEFPKINELGNDSKKLYEYTISLMLAQPQTATQDAIELFFLQELNTEPDNELLLSLNLKAAPYIEAYVRSEFKFRTMLALDKAGIHVEIYGGDSWKSTKYPFSSNIRIHDWISSDECNRMVGRTKISLNCMPWYKEGCSERVFNNMINGAVSLTDTSTYLTERFTHGKELVFYNLDALDEMAEVVNYLLDNPDVAEGIATRGMEVARNRDTWEHRFRQVMSFLP